MRTVEIPGTRFVRWTPTCEDIVFAEDDAGRLWRAQRAWYGRKDGERLIYEWKWFPLPHHPLCACGEHGTPGTP